MTDDPALALAEHVGSIHPGVSVLGATLAVCDQLGTVTGKELLLGVARARRVVPYRTADGQGSHQEEFWRHGKRHRPAEEGPAAYGTDRHGKLLREIYYEDGACHRDPSQGPA